MRQILTHEELRAAKNAPFQDSSGQRPSTVPMRTRRRSARYGRDGGATRRPAGGGHRAHADLDVNLEGVDDTWMNGGVEIDIEAVFSGNSPEVPSFYVDRSATQTAQDDREIASEFAKLTKSTTLLLIGRLGNGCLPAECDAICPSFKLISMRSNGQTKVAMFSVPVEREMAELFEEIDGRPGIKAVAYDARGRIKEAYVL